MLKSRSHAVARHVMALFGAILYAMEGVAQTTQAQCEAGFDWMTNSKRQSPCLVLAYLDAACSPEPSSEWVGNALSPGEEYGLSKDGADQCHCSTVTYSVLAACSACQGATYARWSDWVQNCTTSNTTIGQYPRAIPSGTAIPAWAYQNVSFTGTFNLNTAESVANQHTPDSTAITITPTLASPSSSKQPVWTVSGSSSGIAVPTVTLKSPNSSKTNVGAIVGGVLGGAAAITACAVILILWTKRSRAARKSTIEVGFSSDIDHDASIGQSNTIEQEKRLSHDFANETPLLPLGARLYDPDDPSTFPDAIHPVLNSTQRGSEYTGHPEF